MDANTAQALLNQMLSADPNQILSAFETAFQDGTFHMFWDFWAIIIPIITYMYTQSERSTMVVTLLILTLGYMYHTLTISLVPLGLAAVLLVAKSLWGVVAQVRS